VLIDTGTAPRLPRCRRRGLCARAAGYAGNYAVAVVWSDGHTGSIYPLATLRKLAEDSTPT
jgi:DUF971 family protein